MGKLFWLEYSLICDNTCNQGRRSHIKGRIVSLDPAVFFGCPYPHGLEGEIGIPHFYCYSIPSGVPYIRCPRYIHRNSEVLCTYCYLACAHLIEHISINAYSVCGTGKYINPLFCHDKGRHIV